MSKQEDAELCMLLTKLLVDINNNESDDNIYDSCDVHFYIAGKRVAVHIKFEIGDLNE